MDRAGFSQRTGRPPTGHSQPGPSHHGNIHGHGAVAAPPGAASKVIKKPRKIDQFYKLVCDPSFDHRRKKQIWRTQGEVLSENLDDKREYNWKPSDGHGERRHRRTREAPELAIPLFEVDNNTVGVPPQREVCIFGLNDNISEDFLKKMASKHGDVWYVIVYHHPETRKHLGIGLIVFVRPCSAPHFCEEFNGKTVMGIVVACRLDPWTALVSHKFESMTMQPCPIPPHLKEMDENRLVRLRDEITAKLFPPKKPATPMDLANSEPIEPYSPDDYTGNPSRTPSTPHISFPKGPTTPPREDLSRPNSGMNRPPSRPSRPGSRGLPMPHRPLTQSPPRPIPEPHPFEYFGLPPPPYPGLNPTPSTHHFTPLPMHDHSGKPTTPPLPPKMDDNDCTVRLRHSDKKRRRSRTRSIDKRRDGTSSRGERKRKRRRHHSSDSSRSSSSSGASTEIEEKKVKEYSLKQKHYFSHEERHTEIVEKIKVTKKTKTFKRSEKRTISPVLPGAEAISEDDSHLSEASVSTGEIMRMKILTKKTTVQLEKAKEMRDRKVEKGKDKERIKHKSDGHRWSTSSSDSDMENNKRRKERRKRDDRCREKTRQAVPSMSTPREVFMSPSIGTPCASFAGSSLGTPDVSRTPLPPGPPPPLPPMNIPPPAGTNGRMNVPKLQHPVLNFTLPPPNMIDTSVPPPNFKPAANFGTPVTVRMRIVEDSPRGSSTPRQEVVPARLPSSPQKESLQDRINSIFGIETRKPPRSPAPQSQQLPDTTSFTRASQSSSSHKVVDMELAEDSDESQQREQDRVFDDTHRQICVEVATSETLSDLKQDLGGVLRNDIYKVIEKVANELLDDFVVKRRQEIEERNILKARESLRATIESRNSDERTPHVTPVKEPTLLISPDGRSTGFYMPKLPSFRRKKLPSPKPVSRSPSRSRSSSAPRKTPDSEDESSGSDSDRAHAASSESDEESEIDDSIRMAKKGRRKQGIQSSSDSVSSSASSSISSSSDSESESVTVKSKATGISSLTTSTLIEEKAPVKEKTKRIVKNKKIETGGKTAVSNAKPKEDAKNGDLAALLKPLEDSVVATKKAADKKPKGKRIPNELAGLLPPPVSVRKGAPSKAFLSVSSKRFARRSADEEEAILYATGLLDEEDQEFLRRVLAKLQPAERVLPQGAEWTELHEGRQKWHFERYVPFLPLEFTPSPTLLDRPSKVGRIDLFYSDKELAGVRPHSTGCARTQGFYRVSHKEKRRLMRRPEGLELRTDISERDETVVRHQVQMSREQKAMNRRLLTTMADTNSELFKVNQLKYRKKMIKFARSRIHGWGLYALEPIAPDDMIVEYVGQKVRPSVADEREKAYERRGIGSSYLFRIDDFEVIDATKKGNFARFINHSCQPNCYAKVVTVDGDKRIVIYSKHLINKGDEITYDYKFPIEDDKIDCLCGAPNCRGFLN